MTGNFALFRRGGLLPTTVRSQTNLRAEGSYGTAKKADLPSITTTEMAYAELRQAFGARQLFSRMGGSVRPRDGEPGTWIYAVASLFHNIAFGLRTEQAYGLGAAYDLEAVPGLAVAADIRYLKEVFDGQSSFSSWAVRVHSSYSHTWVVGPDSAPRFLYFAVSAEVIPAFESADALQARWLVRLGSPDPEQPRALEGDFGSDYMKNVPPAFKPHYWRSNVGLTWNFGVK